MLETIIQKRGSGKTTQCIKEMIDHHDWVLLVPHRHMIGLYPSNLRSRIFTVEEFLRTHHLIRYERWQGYAKDTFERSAFNNGPSKILIDEGFILEPEVAAELYYRLGNQNYDVKVIGSIRN